MSIKSNFQIFEPEPRVLHLLFRNQRDLTQSMMRLQEYYEGPDIQGTYFTLDEFLHYYTKPNGSFDYTQIWGGFNVPGHVVDAWQAVFEPRDGLTIKERQMMAAVRQHLSGSDDDWYLICTEGKPMDSTVRHELAHARYYLCEGYRAQCESLVGEMQTKDVKKFKRKLLKMGYAESVITDEIQAYSSTDSYEEVEDRFGSMHPNTQDAMKKLRKLYRNWRYEQV